MNDLRSAERGGALFSEKRKERRQAQAGKQRKRAWKLDDNVFFSVISIGHI